MSTWEVDDTSGVGEVEVVVFVCSQPWLKRVESSASHTQMNTHIVLHKHTQGHWSTVGISSDPWPGSHRALLVGVSVSHPTGTPVCEHTASTHSKCLCEVVCVCLSCLREEKVEGDGRKERGERNQSRAAAKKKKGKAQTRKYASFLFVSSPSRTRPHMVVSTMITERWSQSLASQKTVSR